MKPSELKKSHWLQYNIQFVLEHIFGLSFLQNKLGGWRKRLQDNIDKYLAKNTAQPGDAFIYDGPTPLGFKYTDTFKGGKTAYVLRGAAAGWEASKKWSFDFFREEYGDRKIVFNETAGVVDPNVPVKYEETNLASFIDEFKNGTRKYLKFSDLVQNEESLQRDLDKTLLDKFGLPGATGKTFYTFMGGKGSITPLHNEFPCNIYVQVYGRKKWVLYPIEDRVYLDPRTERRPYFFSSVNPDNTADPRYPLQKHAHKIEVILEPGDMICVPPFVWHYIENVTDSIGVAYKFAHIPSALRSSTLLTTLFMLSTRPSIFYTFIANRLKKDDVLLNKY